MFDLPPCLSAALGAGGGGASCIRNATVPVSVLPSIFMVRVGAGGTGGSFLGQSDPTDGGDTFLMNVSASIVGIAFGGKAAQDRMGGNGSSMQSLAGGAGGAVGGSGGNGMVSADAASGGGGSGQNVGSPIEGGSVGSTPGGKSEQSGTCCPGVGGASLLGSGGSAICASYASGPGHGGGGYGEFLANGDVPSSNGGNGIAIITFFSLP